MVTRIHRGDVWWAETEDKRRPVLILTRDTAIPVLRTVAIAPITRRLRAIPTQVRLDPADGMPVECAASFDNLATVEQSALTDRITGLSAQRMADVCRALALALDCH